MTTIQAQAVGNGVLLARRDLDRLLELARRSEAVDLKIEEDDFPTADMMRLSEIGGSLGCWHDEGEDIYSIDDGEPIR